MNISLFSEFEKHLNIFRALTLLVIALVILISAGKMIRRPPAYGDFGVYLHAAKLLVSGENIYATPTHPVSDGGLFYIYPPLFALLFVPFTWIPTNLSIIAWCMFNVFLVGWVVKAFSEMLSGESFFSLPVKTRWIIGFFSVFLTARFILHHLDRGQANILEMALAVLALKLIHHKEAISGGAVAGFSIALKVVTLPISIWFVLQRNLKALAGIALGTITGVVLPALFLGFEKNLHFLNLWLNQYVFDSAERESKLGLAYNYSPLAQLYRFFTPSVAFEHRGQQYSMMIFKAPLGWIHGADWLIRFAVAGTIVIYWFKFRNGPKTVLNGALALVFALVPLFFPTTQINYFVFLLPAYVYIVYLWYCLDFKDKWFRRFAVASFLFASFTTDGIWGNLIGYAFAAAGCILWGNVFVILAIFRAASRLCEEERHVGVRVAVPQLSQAVSELKRR